MNSSMLTWMRCVAIANLCLVRVWVELFAYRPWPAHRDYAPPQGVHYLAAAALCLLLGTVLYAIHRTATPGVKAVAGGFAVLISLKTTFLALSNVGWFPRDGFLGAARWVLVLVGLLLIPAAIHLSRRVRLDGMVRNFASAMLPFAALTIGQSLWIAFQAPPASAASASPVRESASSADPPRDSHAARRRFVWIVFDEFDERIAFSQRPEGLSLPAFDRFRSEASFVARRASSPANSTSISIPALLSGRLPEAPNRMSGAILERLTRKNLRTAVVGWALPYCPELGPNVTECSWWPMAQQHNSYGDGVFDGIFGRVRSLFESNHISPFGQSLAVRHHVSQVAEITRAATSAAARPDLDFVFLHLPHTHNPFIWNPETRQPDLPAHPWDRRGYLRNLPWADEAFAGIRGAMEASGVWDRSTVLVSGDHGYRNAAALGYAGEELHVPFMLKSPAPLTPLDPDAPLETIRTTEILDGLLEQN